MNRNPEVGRWFDEQDHPLDDVDAESGEIILGADERVTESIKWKNPPTFALHGASRASTRRRT